MAEGRGSQARSSTRKSSSTSGGSSKSAGSRGSSKSGGSGGSGGSSKSGGSGGSGGSSRSAAASKSGGSRASGSGGGRGSNQSSSRRTSGITGREAVQQAREQLAEVMGRPVEAVLAMERDEDGWTITVQVVELERIPNSTDVLGSYVVSVDQDGEVVGYRRTKRYHRSQAGEG